MSHPHPHTALAKASIIASLGSRILPPEGDRFGIVLARDVDGRDRMGDDYAGDDYAGDDYAGDDFGDELGDLLGDLLGDAADGVERAELLGAVYRGMRTGGKGRGAPARRGGGAPPRRGGGGGGGGGGGLARRRGDDRLARGAARLGAILRGKTPWRETVQTPGVNDNYEGLVRLPFVSATGSNTFPAGATVWSFTGKPQKPWRGERLVAIVKTSAGAAAIIPLLQSIRVGVDPQEAGTGNTPLEEYQPGSFGVRECWAPSQPGLEVVISGIFSAAIPAGEFVTIALSAHGRWVA